MESLDVANLLNEGSVCGVIIILYNHNHLLVDDNDQEKKGQKDIS